MVGVHKLLSWHFYLVFCQFFTKAVAQIANCKTRLYCITAVNMNSISSVKSLYSIIQLDSEEDGNALCATSYIK